MKTLKYILFYIVQWTWGILMNIVGLFCLLFAWITGEKIRRCGPYIYMYSKYCKGGSFSVGMFVVLSYYGDSSMPHEMGHGIQNMIFGPLMPFIVAIPSVIRFWYREYKIRKGQGAQLPPYDSIWYERTATQWGTKYFGKTWEEHLATRQ